MHNLPFVRPSVHFVFGETSYLSPPSAQDRKLEVTGTGTGGNGGITQGKVGKAVMRGLGHLVVFEKPGEVAGAVGKWIKEWYRGWLKEEEFWREYKSKTSDESMLRTSKAWVEALRLPVDTLRSKGPKL